MECANTHETAGEEQKKVCCPLLVAPVVGVVVGANFIDLGSTFTSHSELSFVVAACGKCQSGSFRLSLRICVNKLALMMISFAHHGMKWRTAADSGVKRLMKVSETLSRRLVDSSRR
jgi:hypothetical protein